jgi:hypothetical protein
VVAVWVTNDPAVQAFVRLQWLPQVLPPQRSLQSHMFR